MLHLVPAGNELQASSLLASVDGARRCYVTCWERTINDSSAQLWTLCATLPAHQARCAYR